MSHLEYHVAYMQAARLCARLHAETFYRNHKMHRACLYCVMMACAEWEIYLKMRGEATETPQGIRRGGA